MNGESDQPSTSSPKLGRQKLLSTETIRNPKPTTSDPSGELSEGIRTMPNLDPLLLCVSEVKSGTAGFDYFEDASLVFNEDFFEASLSQNNPNASKPILNDLEARSVLQVNPSNGIRQKPEREQSGSRGQPLENYHLQIHRTEEPSRVTSIRSDQSLVGTRLVDEKLLRQSRGTVIPNGSTIHTTNLQNPTYLECHMQSCPESVLSGALLKQSKPCSIRSATIVSNTKKENEFVCSNYLDKSIDLKQNIPPCEERSSLKERDPRLVNVSQQQGQLNTFISTCGRDSPITIEMTHIVSLRRVKQGDGSTMYVKDTQLRKCQCVCTCLNSKSAVHEVESQPVRLPCLPLVNEACQTPQQMGYLIDSRLQKTYLDQQQSSLDFQSVDSRLATEPAEEPVENTVKCCAASQCYSEPNQNGEPKGVTNRQYHTNSFLKPQQSTSHEGSSESVICPTCCPTKTERKTQPQSSVVANETTRYKSDVTVVGVRQDMTDPLRRQDDMTDLEELELVRRSNHEIGTYIGRCNCPDKTSCECELRRPLEEGRVCCVDYSTPKGGCLVEPAAIRVEEKFTRSEVTEKGSAVEDKDETSNPCYFCFRRRRKSKLPEPVSREIESWPGNLDKSQVVFYRYDEESPPNTLVSAVRSIQCPSDPGESVASLQIYRLMDDPNLHSIHDDRVSEGGCVKAATIAPATGVRYVKLIDPVKSYRAVVHSVPRPSCERTPSEFVNTIPEYYPKKEVEYRKPCHLPLGTVVEQTVPKIPSQVCSTSNLTSEPSPVLHPWRCCDVNTVMNPPLPCSKPADRNFFARPVDPIPTPARELSIVESQHIEAAEYPLSPCCPCPHERPLSFIHMQHVWPNCLANLPWACRCKRVMNDCCSCPQIRWGCDNLTYQGAQTHYYSKPERSQEGGLCECRNRLLTCPLA
ncbi:hypothetical protein X801_08664 [Opisthorchis viverrini]|uniref:Uncharacterized protein n=2 Tax=Opisthorchis viverrini TaxID=6198 RepID=A0A1S8WM36_OPIVI|nr:hypothetical protein T265_01018 [Opisthorchis viverrini]KER33134.1 hypothetical protein T265_01018 [Opisthorchis viverrini]OON15530.1 hypothetical protein X801_08664 [Opisthorchis viverrini]